VDSLRAKGFSNLYIDGGKTIQSFLDHNMIDEITITTVPLVLGDGIPLFGTRNNQLSFTHHQTIVYDNGLIKSTYRKK
jgi:dihydrofolate reductase